MFVRSAARYGYNVRYVYLTAAPGQSDIMQVRIQSQGTFVRSLCADTVVMVVDAYDVFFRQPPSTALARFKSFGANIVWSVERFYNGQDTGDLSFWDEVENHTTPFNYINSGGFMGYAGTVARLIDVALSVRPGAESWHNKTCGAPRGRICSDQWVYGHLLAHTWNKFHVSLDRNTSIFYVASSHDWSLDRARTRIVTYEPIVVHMPFIQAPRVNATLHALFEEFVRAPRARRAAARPLAGDARS
jgi:hypothetical protein